MPITVKHLKVSTIPDTTDTDLVRPSDWNADHTIVGTNEIANGGTNSTATPTAGAVAYGTGTAYAFSTAGTAGQVLQSNGSSAPSWVASPAAGAGGSNTQIQFNNAGVLAGNSTYTMVSGVMKENGFNFVSQADVGSNPNQVPLNQYLGTMAYQDNAGVNITGGTVSNVTNTGIATFSAGTAALPSITTTGDTNTGIFFPAADTIAFAEGGVEAMRIPATGGVQVVNCVSVGNATPSASGAGITFPATQSASTDANTLDDYEEGTWTPSIGGTATYNAQEGTYTKIGNVVTVSGRIHVLLKLTGSGTVVSGLPFTSAATYRYGIAIGRYSAIASSAFTVYGELPASSTTFELFCTTAAGTSNYVSAVFADNTNIVFTFTYRI